MIIDYRVWVTDNKTAASMVKVLKGPNSNETFAQSFQMVNHSCPQTSESTHD